jgi:hypothetical protein
MHSKKAIVLSTLIGLVVVSIIVVFVVVPLFEAGYNLIVTKPDYASLQGFERLSYAIQNAEEGKTSYIPVGIDQGFKITTQNFDKSCLRNCICLCKADSANQNGCLIKIYMEKCSASDILLNGEFSPSKFGAGKAQVPALLQVSKSGKTIQISGDYVGACNFDTFDKCMAADNCFVKVGEKSIAGLILPSYYFECMPCRDELPNSLNIPKVDCQRYSYYETQAVTSGITTIDKFSVSVDNPYIDYSASQCGKDPCGLRPKGFDCQWDGNNGECKAKPAPSPAPP